jgi:hypothetical protein
MEQNVKIVSYNDVLVSYIRIHFKVRFLFQKPTSVLVIHVLMVEHVQIRLMATRVHV